MEWTVVTALVVIAGLVAAIAKPIVTFTRAFSETTATLTASMNELKHSFDRFSAENKESHGRIYDRLDEHDAQLGEHERRIGLLEHDGGGLQ